VENPHRGKVVIGCILGIFLAASEGTIVGTAMPSIVEDLGGFALYHWVFSVYMLASAVSMPFWGKLADLYGPRRLFVVGGLLFISGSALAGTAPTMEHLVAYRVLQGAGAGSLFALPLTILAHETPPERRGHVMGFAAGTWGVAAILGPPVGAGIVSLLGWRWVFYIAIPFGVTGLLLVKRYALDPPTAGSPRLDIAGGLTLAAVVLGLLMGAQSVREGAPILGVSATFWFLAAVLLLPVFFLIERRARDPIVPMRLLRHPLYRVANAGSYLMAFCVFCAIVYVPMLTTMGERTDVVRAGLSLVPASLGWATGAIVGGRIVARVGGRRLAMLGAGLSAAGFIAATRFTPESSLLQIMPVMFPIGLGIGLTSPAILVTLQNHLGTGNMGVVTSGVAFYRHLGGSMGVALFGALIPAVADERLVSTGTDPAVVQGVQWVFFAAAAVLIFALLLMTRLPSSIIPEEVG
jgi:EmrB/QacA subfamily drug resistance transporter